MQNSYTYLLKHSWKFAKNQRKSFFIIYSFFMLSNFVSSLRPILYGWFINKLQGNRSELMPFAWTYIVLYISLYFVDWIFHGPAVLLENKLSYTIGKNFVSYLFDQLLHLPIDWHKTHHTGSTINRIRKAESALRNFFSACVLHLRLIVQFITAISAMLYFSPLFALVSISFGIISFVTIRQFDKPYIRYLTEANEGEHSISATLTDSLSNILTVVTLRLQNKFGKRLTDQININFKPYWKGTILNESKWFTAGLFVNIIYCVMVIGYIYSNYKPGKVFEIGGLVTLLGFVSQFAGVFADVGHVYNQIIKDSTDVKGVENIQSMYKEHNNTNSYSLLPSDWKTLNVEDLNFSYENSITEKFNTISLPSSLNSLSSGGLHGISLSFEKGQRIALIGHNGSGKSTLMSIFKGLYTPQLNSKLFIDNKEIVDWRSLADDVTLFPQQPEMFENTIGYNLTLGLPFSPSEIMEACRIAGFTSTLEEFPNGLKHVVQENGSNLSGGQRQRLALARGILASQNSSIILLDEFASNIDEHTESEIYRLLFEAFSHKTIICSIQKLSLLSFFDKTYLLKKGKIVLEGTFDEVKGNLEKEFVDSP